MRALILLVSACGFHGPATEILGQHDASLVDGEGPNDTVGTTDARTDAGGQPGLDALPSIDASPIADAKPAFSCGTSGASEMLCLAFENNVTDGSPSHLTVDVSGNGVSYATGVDGLSIALDAGDSLSIDSSAANLLTTQSSTLAIRVAVNPFSLPTAGARMGIVDNDSYRMFIMPGGAVRCALGNGATGGWADLTTTGAGLATGVFTRVTCAYNAVTMSIYFNGVLKNSTGNIKGVPLVTTSTQIGGNQGGGGGDNLVGYLDDFQLFNTSNVTP